jgi:hypothetical protein
MLGELNEKQARIGNTTHTARHLRSLSTRYLTNQSQRGPNRTGRALFDLPLDFDARVSSSANVRPSAVSRRHTVHFLFRFKLASTRLWGFYLEASSHLQAATLRELVFRPVGVSHPVPHRFPDG